MSAATSDGGRVLAPEVAAELGNVLDALHVAGKALVRCQTGPLNIDALQDAVHEVAAEAAVASQAAHELAEGTPLADTFPAGAPVPDRPTPRQVLYLRDLAQRRRARLKWGDLEAAADAGAFDDLDPPAGA